ncbi:cytochrome P450 [Epithele typhae]|uniref:cytochrome P450 n=1 Tax=Epithele typhae TaxID=378194 RepID=UPI00200758B0|nr:cytochrome P450 [Epithele typhae]KAH9929109.1 cytochrome P450 [Epithele typhae]
MGPATPSLISVALWVLCISLVGYALSTLRRRSRSCLLPFPPGPKGLPLVGNVLDFPTRQTWHDHLGVRCCTGDVLHFRVLGESIIVLNSAAAVTELLEKNSANTADRARSVDLMVELTGNTHNFGFMPYGQRWRDHRRVFWQYFHRDSVRAHHSTQRAVTHLLLDKLLTSPSEFKTHTRKAFTASVLHFVYGIDYASDDAGDKYAAAMETALVSVVEGMIPGRFMVQYLPFLRYAPSWLPGMGWQELLAQWRADNYQALTMPYEYSRANMDRQTDVKESMLGRHIASRSRNGEMPARDEEILKGTSAIAFEAGMDTVSTTHVFTLQGGFLHFPSPEVVKKAQEELDTVVGPHRLPEFDDEPSLLYLRAVIMELLRWHNVLSIGVAHATTNDDVWRGWFIPAGRSFSLTACMHDPQLFPDPHEFRPERFIKDGVIDTTVLDPTTFVFGYGRRICAGRHFARAGLFITIASILHVFDVSAPLDEQGKPIKIEPRFTDGLFSYPEDCRCTITPRSSAHAALIRTNAAAVRAARGI